MVLKEKIVDKLKSVIDPETGVDVVQMDLIKDLKVADDGKVSLKFSPSAAFCPLAYQLAFGIRDAIKEVEGVTGVEVEVINYLHADELNKVLREAEGR